MCAKHSRSSQDVYSVSTYNEAHSKPSKSPQSQHAFAQNYAEIDSLGEEYLTQDKVQA